MSIKTTIQGLITTLIRTNPALIDKTEHADVEDALLANLYADVIAETHLSGTITDQTSDANFYSLHFCKQGRKVTVTGVLNNKQLSITSTTSFFEVVDSEYFPALSVVSGQKIIGNASNDNRPIKMRFTANKLLLDGSSLGVGQNVYVTFEYLTEN